MPPRTVRGVRTRARAACGSQALEVIDLRGGTTAAFPVRMGATVLVVDDEPLMRRALARELRSAYTVLEAASVEEAMALLERAEPVCAVVTDLNMEGGTGRELLEVVQRRDPLCARVLVSAVARPQVGEECQTFVRKPWHDGELRAAVANVWIRL